MPVHVRFRFNKTTGEVEEFLIDDQDRNLPESEHDRIAVDVGQTVVRRAQPIEVLPSNVKPSTEAVPDDTPERDTETTPETVKE